MNIFRFEDVSLDKEYRQYFIWNRNQKPFSKNTKHKKDHEEQKQQQQQEKKENRRKRMKLWNQKVVYSTRPIG